MLLFYWELVAFLNSHSLRTQLILYHGETDFPRRYSGITHFTAYRIPKHFMVRCWQILKVLHNQYHVSYYATVSFLKYKKFCTNKWNHISYIFILFLKLFNFIHDCDAIIILPRMVLCYSSNLLLLCMTFPFSNRLNK
jgi:hypothetical protein